jgi:dsRNA-specific ribonuclease
MDVVLRNETPQLVDAEWLSKYRLFIFETLRPIVKQDSNLKDLVDEQAMKLWVRAVTHELYNMAESYEDLETYGDTILNTCFNMYIVKKFPGIKKDSLTELNHYYMSELYQHSLAKKMGLDLWVRAPEVNRKVLEDVFESFFGALYQVSVLKSNDGRAFVNCLNMLTHIFSTITIDPNQIAAVKSVVQQNVQRLGYGRVFEIWLDEQGHRIRMIKSENTTSKGADGKHRLKLLIPRDAISYLLTKNIRLVPEYGPYVGMRKKDVEREAYADVYKKMQEAGFTKAWVDEETRTRKGGDDPRMIEWLPKILEEVRTRGYDDFRFETTPYNEDDDHAYVTLYLIKKNKNDVIVQARNVDNIRFTVGIDDNENQKESQRARELLIKKFVPLIAK